jgi:excinuclease ABC subunit B
MNTFKLHPPFPPAGDQQQAIDSLVQARPGKSTLLGVTGSGKTYTIAQVIAKQDRPVIVLAPNKTLAAQLYEEFVQFFPENRVCYFVSYYDYYQPESYVPAQDKYTPKEAKINKEIERLRVETAASLVTRNDTIVIASVSSIYSLGDPTDFKTAAVSVSVGQQISRDSLVRQLEHIQYRRTELERGPGSLHERDDWLEITVPYAQERLQIVFEQDRVQRIELRRRHDDSLVETQTATLIFPARHFVMSEDKRKRAIISIREELEQWLPKLSEQHYRDRLQSRVERDIELLEKHGYCPGIENYSIHFDGRPWGNPPFCLLDFFEDPLIVIDESHLMLPQLQGMYAGDRIRKKNLVEFGFRLPSAYENRPLRFEETERYFRDVIFVSATPGRYEVENSSHIVEQVVRPTGLIDPEITIRSREQQLDTLVAEIEGTRQRGYRTLVTVLTKKMAEDLALYLEQKHIKVCYLHSDLKTPQRTEILHKLRAGVFDCVVGVNLLREGLDLPEVALVAIMDADIEGFLRDKRSLIQTIGRAARNIDAKVVLYADKMTESMRNAIDETDRRRAIQKGHNTAHGIIPRTVVRTVTKSISPLQQAIARASKVVPIKKRALLSMSTTELDQRIAELQTSMQEAAEHHDYDVAIHLRDEWFILTKRRTEIQAESPEHSMVSQDILEQ